MTEPGEDTCLRCHHPDHFGGTCGALMGTFYGDDGRTEDDSCDCTTYRLHNVGGFIRSGAIWISDDDQEDPF